MTKITKNYRCTNGIRQRVGRTWYAQRKVQLNGKWVTVRMHRQILWLSYGDKLQVDHKNGNGLDNKREQPSVGNPAAEPAKRTAESQQQMLLQGRCWRLSVSSP